MLLLLLLLIPILGIFVISTAISLNLSALKVKQIKLTALTTSILNLFLSLIIFILFDFSSNQFQFVQEYHQISSFDFYLGVDGLSIYFVLLTTIIIPISLLSNWISITENIRAYVIIILLLETLLLAVFLVLDVLLFYIFFESILPPLFILIVRRGAFFDSLRKLQIHFPNVYQTPSLGKRRKSMPNRACLEKVQTIAKQLAIMQGSVKLDMVRAILPEVQSPVFSKKGGELDCDGFFHRYTTSIYLGSCNGIMMMRCAKSIIKVMSVQPKFKYSFYEERTTVSTKGSNSYVAGGLVLAARNINFVYCMPKGIARWKGPVHNQTRTLSTGPGRTVNVLKKLDSLHSRSHLATDKRIDRKLYRDFILDKDIYLAAYHKLRSRPGMMTPGIDPTTLDGLSSEVIMDIINKLATGEFQFTPGRRTEISKADGKPRPVTVGNPRDKLVQEVMRMVIEAIYEPVFMDASHGFRANRGCHTALRTIYSKFTGTAWWIEGDIKSCFDSISHNKLMKRLENKIEDQRFLELIRKALNAGYLLSGNRETDIIGTPQGSVISPILANIYLHELDVFVEKLKQTFDSTYTGPRIRTKESYHARYLLRKARAKEDPKLRAKEILKRAIICRSIANKTVGSHTKKLMYVRYADDWVIAINGTRTEAVEILNKVREFCYSHLGLKLSEEKTKITNSYKDKILFLGTYIRHGLATTYSRHRGGVLQRNTRRILLTAPMDRIKAKLIKAGFIKNNRAQTRVTWLPLTARQIINLANQVIRGYLNYYSFVQNRGKFAPFIYWIVRDVVVRTFARKFQLKTRAQVYKRYGKHLTIVDLTKRDKGSRPMTVARVYRPENWKMNVWDFKIKSPNTIVSALYSNVVSLANIDAMSCIVCKSDYRVEMHHVRMMKDLSPQTDRLDYLMSRAQRKQIPLCRSCHMKYHGGKLYIP